MILDTFKCDRCGDEEGPFDPQELPGEFVTIIEPCEAHGCHEWNYCGWECAMHACASHLDHYEKLEQEDHETD